MSQLNDAMYNALRAALFTGSVNDMLIQWLKQQGANGSSLPDLWYDFLINQVAPQLLPAARLDLQHASWNVSGITVNDRVSVTVANTNGYMYIFEVVPVVPGEDYIYTFTIEYDDQNFTLYHAVYDVVNLSFILVDQPSISGRNTVRFTAPAGCTDARPYPLRYSSNVDVDANIYGMSLRKSTGGLKKQDLERAYLIDQGIASDHLNKMWLDYWLRGV